MHPSNSPFTLSIREVSNQGSYSSKLAPSEIERMQREIAATDEEIDELVYKLYGSTDEEQKIIERGTK